jgi:hypothetical protein
LKKALLGKRVSDSLAKSLGFVTLLKKHKDFELASQPLRTGSESTPAKKTVTAHATFSMFLYLTYNYY